jgi:hypothetical protein
LALLSPLGTAVLDGGPALIEKSLMDGFSYMTEDQ